MRTKANLQDSIDKLSARVLELEIQLKYTIEPRLQISIATGQTEAVMGHAFGPGALRVQPQFHHLKLADAINQIAQHLGLKFTYIKGTPDTVSLQPKDPK